MISLKKTSVKTKAGMFILEISPKGLYAVRFPGNGQRSTDNMAASKFFVDRCALTVVPKKMIFTDLFKKVASQKLDLTGYTPFQLRVCAALKKVPAGETVTYGALARRAGYPGAARAVGTAMKNNRLPIVIPCHRVVPAAGGLGEYSAGKQWKRWLLEYEKWDSSPGTRDSKKSRNQNESRGASPESHDDSL